MSEEAAGPESYIPLARPLCLILLRIGTTIIQCVVGGPENCESVRYVKVKLKYGTFRRSPTQPNHALTFRRRGIDRME